ncbi:hypothetical protein [Spiroplasma sp. DGKH1]|uniref:hypothetical protein n=1 Tax=Spiroplasma sp. DGKH1 TaxID=3050074 RepID=UPI0034C66782
MKKSIWALFFSSFLVLPLASIINFFVNADLNNTNDLSQIVNPSRGWPAKNKNQLRIWEFLYDDTQQKIVAVNNKILNNFYAFYNNEYQKYKPTAPEHAGQPGYDEIGIPNDVINNYIKNKIILSYDMQVFSALSLRSYYIELSINKINDPTNNTINPNEYLSLWVMKYFTAGIYYQWAKIWVPDLGRTVEKPIDIDFYTFGSLVKQDSDGNPIWSEGPDEAAAAKVKPLLKLDPIMNKLINTIYDELFLN